MLQIGAFKSAKKSKLAGLLFLLFTKLSAGLARASAARLADSARADVFGTAEF